MYPYGHGPGWKTLGTLHGRPPSWWAKTTLPSPRVSPSCSPAPPVPWSLLCAAHCAWPLVWMTGPSQLCLVPWLVNGQGEARSGTVDVIRSCNDQLQEDTSIAWDVQTAKSKPPASISAIAFYAQIISVSFLELYCGGLENSRLQEKGCRGGKITCLSRSLSVIDVSPRVSSKVPGASLWKFFLFVSLELIKTWITKWEFIHILKSQRNDLWGLFRKHDPALSLLE